MTEEEYLRMRNLLDEVIAQQARSEERQAKTDEQLARNAEQIARNTEGIAALLTLAQIHEGEISRTNQQMSEHFKRTDDRINALVDVVERYITKGQ